MKYLLLNHKMNLLGKDLTEYIKKLPTKPNVIVFPTSIYIPYFLGKEFSIGCQDVSDKDLGSVTSEINAKQLKSIGVEYTLIGHSERRTNYQEENKQIKNKLNQALKAGLTAVLCIGEKDSTNKYEILNEQLEEALKDMPFNKNIWIAYEPVAAIGRGTAITNEEINETTTWIRNWFIEKYKETPIILYGGSVNDENIGELLKTNTDGFLVGGASLSVEKVQKMYEEINK